MQGISSPGASTQRPASWPSLIHEQSEAYNLSTMAESLFSTFPMLDAAIVNAVAEQFVSPSGQVDILEARRALEMMLPPGIHPCTPEALPDSICIVDPMQPLPYGHPNMSPPSTTFSTHVHRSAMRCLDVHIFCSSPDLFLTRRTVSREPCGRHGVVHQFQKLCGDTGR